MATSKSSLNWPSDVRNLPRRSTILTASDGFERGRIIWLMRTLVSKTTRRSVVIAQKLGQLFLSQPACFGLASGLLTESEKFLHLQPAQPFVVFDGDHGRYVALV